MEMEGGDGDQGCVVSEGGEKEAKRGPLSKTSMSGEV